MNIKKQSLKKVTYLRAHDADKSHTIILGGDSRWMRDIELLLEDQWKNVYCPEDASAFKKTLSEHPPRILVVEQGAYQGNETRLLDLSLPTGTEKILITHTIKDPLSWRRTQRIMASKDVKCVELSEDSKLAAEEMAEIFIGLCATGFSLGEDLQLIQNSFQGYQLVVGKGDSNILNLFKTMAAKFVFEPSDIVAGTLFAETYTLWRQLKDVNSPLQFAYTNAELSVKDQVIFKLIEFSKQCFDSFHANGGLDHSTYQRLVENAQFGRLTARMINGSFQEVISCLSKNSRNLRLVKVA